MSTDSSTALVLFGDPGEVALFDPADSKAGFENVTQRDIGIPSLVKLEDRSRYVDPKHKDYVHVPGAQVGDLLLTPANIVFKSGAVVVPFGYVRTWVQMRPRAAGGGFVAAHAEQPRDMRVVNVGGKDVRVMPNGDEIKETANFGVLVNVPSGEWLPTVLRMTGFSLRTARQWISLSVATGRPLFGMAYTVSTAPESNNLGNFLVYKVASVGAVAHKPLYEEAKAQHAQFATVFSGLKATEVVDEAY